MASSGIAFAQSGTGTLVGEATLVDCIVVGRYSEEHRCLMPYSPQEHDLELFLGRPISWWEAGRL